MMSTWYLVSCTNPLRYFEVLRINMYINMYMSTNMSTNMSTTYYIPVVGVGKGRRTLIGSW